MAVTAVGLALCVLPTWGSQADATEFTTGSAGTTDQTRTMTTPSGFDVKVTGSTLMSATDVSGLKFELGAAPTWMDTTPQVSFDDQAVSAVSGGAGTVWAYPTAWNFDGQFHPYQTVTLSFEHPLTDPVIAVGNYPRFGYSEPGSSRNGVGTSVQQMTVTGVRNGGATVPFSMSLGAKFTSGYHLEDGNRVTPTLVGGALPYMSSTAFYCSDGSQGATDPSFSQYIDPLFAAGGERAGQPNTVSYVTGLCGQLRLDTAGRPVTQLTLQVDQSYLGVAGGQLWNGMGWPADVFTVSTPDEVSGALTPASLGAATHTISDLRIGSDIRSAYDSSVLSSPRAGSGSQSSDAGYTPEDQIVRAPLTNKSAGSYTVTVPYSGVSKTAYLSGWIDFNASGTWDPGEMATSVATITPDSTGAGTATLTFTIPPGGLTPTPQGSPGLTARFRLAYDQAEVNNPTGFAASGEVEDHSWAVLNANSQIQVAKTAEVVGGGNAVVGSSIKYTVSLTNQSATDAATGVTFTDTLPDGMEYDADTTGSAAGITPNGQVLSWGPQTIAAGGTATIVYYATATSVGTKTNVVVVDSADGCTSTGLPDGDPCSGSSTVVVSHSGGLDLAKSVVSPAAPFTVGQTVTYRLTVHNSSTEPISQITVSDPMVEALGGSCTLGATTLAPDASTTCDVTYVVTQADVDGRILTNTATADGQWPDGTAVPQAQAQKSDPTAGVSGALVIAKTSTITDTEGNPSVTALEGYHVNYTITATNTSGYTMSDVTVTDEMLGDLGGTTTPCAVAGDPVTFPLASLAPAGVMTCTGTYTVTAADVAAGRVHNVATGTADLPVDPLNPDEPVPADVVPGTNDVPAGALNLVKQSFMAGRELSSTDRVDVGDRIDYVITVTNTTDYPMDRVVISDPAMSGSEPLTCTPDPASPVTPRPLDPHTAVVCRGTHVVTQDDVNAGHVANTATVSGNFAPNPDPDDPSPWPDPNTPLPPSTDTVDDVTNYDPGVTLTKVAVVTNPAGTVKQQAAAGDTITFTLVARNTGNLPVSGFAIDDPMFPDLGTQAGDCFANTVGGTSVTFPIATFKPADLIVCQVSRTVSAADVAAGVIHNTATAAGDVPGQVDPSDPGTPVPDAPLPPSDADSTTPGGLSVVKTVSRGGTVLTPSDTVSLGDVLTYQVVVTNPTPFDMTNVTLTDPMLVAAGSALDCEGAPHDLAAGDSFTCTGTYTVTQADLDAGHIANVATAQGTWDNPDDPTAPQGPVDPAEGSTDTPTDGAAGHLAMTKTSVVRAADGAAVVQQAQAGDVVTYTVTATNTGTVTMRNVALTDDHQAALGQAAGQCTVDGAGVTLPLAALAPSQQIVCVYTYTVTQGDVTAGHLLNVATGSGTTPAPYDPDNPGQPDIPVIPDPASDDVPTGGLQVTKVAQVNGQVTQGPVHEGDVVTYVITVANTTAFPMTGVQLTDPLLTDGSGVAQYTCEGGLPRDLAAASSFTCTGTYTVTSDDVAAGTLINTATATGEWAPNPDPEAHPSWPSGPVDPAEGSVDTVVAGDVAVLVITKDATITRADGAGAQQAMAGDTIHWTVRATNTSTSDTLTSVDVNDPLVGGALGRTDGQCQVGGTAVRLPLATLAPGQVIVCTADYTVTQADQDAGSVLNVATGTASAPDPDNPGGPDVPATVVPGRDEVPAGGLVVVKTARIGGVLVSDQNPAHVGDTITYQITLANPTPFPMVNVQLDDQMLADNGTVSCTPELPAPLAAGGVITCTGSHEVTQDDVDAGHVLNEATGTANWGPNPDPDSGTTWPTGPVDPSQDDADTPADPGPSALVVVKTAVIKDKVTGATKPQAAEGDTVTYRIAATNTSLRTMSAVTISDPMFPDLASQASCTVDGTDVTLPVATLAPGGVVVCTIDYTVKATDVEAGHVRNVATATGELPNPDDPNQPIPVDPGTGDNDYPVGGLQVTKEAFLGTTPITDQKLLVGQEVTYKVTIHNPTTYDMVRVFVRDDLLGLAGLSCPGASADGTFNLPGGGSEVCSGSYTVTQDDVDAGHVVNVATATGEWAPSDDPNAPSGPVPGGQDQVDDPTDPGPDQLAVAKTSVIRDASTGAQKQAAMPGDTITFTITATNTSLRTMSDVVVSDPMFPQLGSTQGVCAVDNTPVTQPVASLAPGKAVVCTVTYTVTDTDATAGHVHNVAAASATLPDGEGGETPADPGQAETDDPVGGLDVVKQVFIGATEVTDQQLTVGQEVVFRVTVTNTSSYRIDNVQVTDQMLADAGIELTCPGQAPWSLAGKASLQCAATYTVTQADVDAGHVANVATATGDWHEDPADPAGPTGPVDPGAGSTDTPTDRVVGDLDIVKTSVARSAATGNVTQQPVEGDTVTYTITATNTSNMTMSNVAISDALLPGLGTGTSVCTAGGPAARVTLPVAELAPSASIRCTDTYTVTAADVKAGRVTNIATGAAVVPPPYVPGEDPGDPIVVPVDPGRADDPVGGLVVKKEAVPSTSTPGAGDTVAYTITVTNATDYPMVGVLLTDPMLSSAQVALSCPGGNPQDLAAHASFQCTATYPVTQADVDAGRVVNTATATGEWGPQPAGSPETNWPSGAVTPASDTVVTPTAVVPGDGLVLTKDAVVNGGAKTKAEKGDTITFTITMRNTTNRTVTNAKVVDDMLAKAGVPLVCEPAIPVDLAPGAAVVCRATYTVTAADVAAGKVHNVATAQGTLPGGDDNSDTPVPVTPGESTTPTVDLTAHLVVTKTAGAARPKAGEQVAYTITVRNAGSQAAAGVIVTDRLPAELSFVSADGGGMYDSVAHAVSWRLTSLDAGATTTYTVQARVVPGTGAGKAVVNTATALTDTGCVSTGGAACTATAQVTVGGHLAMTGASVGGLLSVIAGLVTAGALLMVNRRREARGDAGGRPTA